MRGSENFEVAANASYSDIMVPTLDTIRSAYIIHMLATNQCPVSPASLPPTAGVSVPQY